MSAASIVMVVFRDLADAHDRLSSGTTSPAAARRNFTAFVNLSQKLTSHMRKEYSDREGGKWNASAFDGWNDVTELFKELRRDDEHERPILILVEEMQYFRIAKDEPQQLALSATWSFSLDTQSAASPHDGLIIEMGDPKTGRPTGQKIAPVRKEYEFLLEPSSSKAKTLLEKIGEKNIRTLSEECFKILSDYYRYYQDRLTQT